jgi:hypothetical protein
MHFVTDDAGLGIFPLIAMQIYCDLLPRAPETVMTLERDFCRSAARFLKLDVNQAWEIQHIYNKVKV